jgi:hypothetical protein
MRHSTSLEQCSPNQTLDGTIPLQPQPLYSNTRCTAGKNKAAMQLELSMRRASCESSLYEQRMLVHISPPESSEAFSGFERVAA